FEGLCVAVASGEVQLDWKARCNSKERTVREALSTCYECSKEISSLAAACPSCGAPLRAGQPSLGSTNATGSSALDFHVCREGKLPVQARAAFGASEQPLVARVADSSSANAAM